MKRKQSPKNRSQWKHILTRRNYGPSLRRQLRELRECTIEERFSAFLVAVEKTPGSTDATRKSWMRALGLPEDPEIFTALREAVQKAAAAEPSA